MLSLLVCDYVPAYFDWDNPKKYCLKQQTFQSLLTDKQESTCLLSYCKSYRNPNLSMDLMERTATCLHCVAVSSCAVSSATCCCNMSTSDGTCHSNHQQCLSIKAQQKIEYRKNPITKIRSHLRSGLAYWNIVVSYHKVVQIHHHLALDQWLHLTYHTRS